MAGIWGDTLAADPLYALQDAVAAGQNWLIQTGLIAYIWIFVAAIVIISIGLIVAGVRNFKFGQIAIGSGGLFLAGIISLIAMGNAIAMVLPVGMAYGVYALARRAIKKREESGAAEGEQAAAAEREAGQEEREEAEEEQEERGEEQEEAGEEFLIREKISKQNLVRFLQQRIGIYVNQGPGTRDSQWPNATVQQVLVALSGKIRPLVNNESAAANKLFAIKKQEERLESLEQKEEDRDKKLAQTVGRLQRAVAQFEKMEWPKVGRRGKQLLQEGRVIDQKINGLLQAQRGAQARIKQWVPMEKQIQRQSEQAIKRFGELARSSLQAVGQFQQGLQRGATGQQIQSSFGRMISYFARSEAMRRQHAQSLARLFAEREQKLAAQEQELLDESEIDGLLARREGIFSQVSAMLRQQQAAQKRRQAAVQADQAGARTRSTKGRKGGQKVRVSQTKGRAATTAAK